jgi:hypothetical protein
MCKFHKCLRIHSQETYSTPQVKDKARTKIFICNCLFHAVTFLFAIKNIDNFVGTSGNEAFTADGNRFL